jgi:hypothetical protein
MHPLEYNHFVKFVSSQNRPQYAYSGSTPNLFFRDIDTLTVLEQLLSDEAISFMTDVEMGPFAVRSRRIGWDLVVQNDREQAVYFAMERIHAMNIFRHRFFICIDRAPKSSPLNGVRSPLTAWR